MLSCFFLFIVDCLDGMGTSLHLLLLPFFGTSDQPCWLAEACKTFFFRSSSSSSLPAPSSLCAPLKLYCQCRLELLGSCRSHFHLPLAAILHPALLHHLPQGHAHPCNPHAHPCNFHAHLCALCMSASRLAPAMIGLLLIYQSRNRANILFMGRLCSDIAPNLP